MQYPLLETLVVGVPLQDPEVTSRSRDINKHGGRVNDLPHPTINMQMYVNDLIYMQIKCK